MHIVYFIPDLPKKLLLWKCFPSECQTCKVIVIYAFNCTEPNKSNLTAAYSHIAMLSLAVVPEQLLHCICKISSIWCYFLTVCVHLGFCCFWVHSVLLWSHEWLVMGKRPPVSACTMKVKTLTTAFYRVSMATGSQMNEKRSPHKEISLVKINDFPYNKKWTPLNMMKACIHIITWWVMSILIALLLSPSRHYEYCFFFFGFLKLFK